MAGLSSTADPTAVAGTGGGVLLAGCASYDLAPALQAGALTPVGR